MSGAWMVRWFDRVGHAVWTTFLPLCVWVPGALLGMIPWVRVTHGTHSSWAPSGTSQHLLCKGTLQLNSFRSLGTGVNTHSTRRLFPEHHLLHIPVFRLSTLGVLGLDCRGKLGKQSENQTFLTMACTEHMQNQTHVFAGRLLPSYLDLSLNWTLSC